VTSSRTVIHRDRSFTFAGRQYRVSQGSDQRTAEWDGYSIVAVLSDVPGDEATIEDGFHRMADVRAYLAKADAEKWAYLGDADGNDPHARTGEGIEA
jgi:hypothetical protein